MLGWKDVLHLSVAYGNFEGLDKIKEMTLKYANTQAFSGSPIIWHLNCTNSQATSMQDS